MTTPPRCNDFKAIGTNSPAGAKIIAASSLVGAGSFEPPAQIAPMLQSEIACRLVSRARESIYFTPFMPRDLRHDVGSWPNP